MGRQINFYATSQDLEALFNMLLTRKDCVILQLVTATLTRVTELPNLERSSSVYISREIDVRNGLLGRKLSLNQWQLEDRVIDLPLIDFLIRPVIGGKLRRSRLFFQTSHNDPLAGYIHRSIEYQKWALDIFAMVRKMTSKVEVFAGVEKFFVAQDAFKHFQSNDIELLLN